MDTSDKMSENSEALMIAALNKSIEAVTLTAASANVPVPTANIPADKAAAAAKAREMGWVEPTAYDYSAYNATEETAQASATDESQPRWLSQAAVYEWNDDYGEVGPPNHELEKQLFFSEFKNRAGGLIDAYEFTITQEGSTRVHPVRKFEDAGLHPVMMENVKLCGYKAPTPVQAYTIPAVLMGKDVVACAQTGSGKTAAYLIPILSRLMGKAKTLAAPRPSANRYNPDTDRVRAEPLVLIICPSRELAGQIFDEARRLCYRTMLRPCVAYGGGPVSIQREELQRGCDILIGTPGRLIDFMGKPNLLSFNRVRFTVIDEADELLHGDWDEQMNKLMNGGDMNEDADHLYLMFSATFNKEARRLAKEYMAEDHMRLRVGRAGSTHTNINQRVYYVDGHMKKKALYDLLFSVPPSRTLIFVKSKREADLIDDYLFNLDLPSTSIHADRTQREREDSLRAFRTGKCPILVTTGVTARGLDIKNVMHVINYDLPTALHGGIEEYVHRIGRTARIGNQGLASSFYNSDNEDIADDLVKILVESKQEVPDFLQDFAPPDGNLEWNDDTDDEIIDEDADGGAPLDDAVWTANESGAFVAEEVGFKADDGVSGNW